MHHETSSKRVGRKRLQRRDAILVAARELIESRGIDGFTIAQLAAALDYTPGALYRYFKSKEAIVAALEADSATAVATALREVIDAWDRDALAKASEVRALGAIVVTAAFYRGLAKRMPADHLLLAQLAGHPRALVDDENAQVAMVPLAALLGVVTALFQRAAQEGALVAGPDAVRAVLFWSSLAGVLQTQKLARFSPELFNDAALTNQLVESLLRSFGANVDALAKATVAAHEFSTTIETRGEA